MASYDITVGGSGAKLPNRLMDGGFMLGFDFNLDEQNLGSGDVANCLYIPADVLILAVRADIVKLEGATLTVDVGLYQADDGTTAIDADCFFDGLDLNNALGDSCSCPGALAEATPNTFSPTGAQGYFPGQAAYFSVLSNNASADTARVKFYLYCVQMTVDEIANKD